MPFRKCEFSSVGQWIVFAETVVIHKMQIRGYLYLRIKNNNIKEDTIISRGFRQYTDVLWSEMTQTVSSVPLSEFIHHRSRHLAILSDCPASERELRLSIWRCCFRRFSSPKNWFWNESFVNWTSLLGLSEALDYREKLVNNVQLLVQTDHFAW